ncbi:Ank1 [Symbiodinium microadriaticum]|nr:Ank1 [Symbiodinium microadriaticum]
MLAQRIQGFGNVNPPPLEEETGATVAKKALGRLGDMVGEEVMLTVEDFKEKGAVGAVKDAVADAGDILIDGVSGIIGWIRGEPPAEEESEKAEDATKALAYGPNGAAYGISQASPTGGINAVWVMPEEADPQAMAQLAAQQGGRAVNDPRVPKNIQPYQPPAGSRAAPPPTSFNQPMQVPGGPVIAPYTPAPAGPSHRPPFVPGAGPGFPAAGFQQGAAAAGASGRWGPGGYSGPAPGAGAGSGASSSASGAKGFVERIAKGDVLVGADAAKRLVSQCSHAKTTAKQLAEMVCERSRRLYLGLDGGDPAEADAALARLLALTDAIYSSDTSDFAKTAVEEIKKGVSEEFMSLRSSAKHKDGALPALQRLGFLGAKAAQEADLLGGEAEVDLLGGGGAVQAAAPSADLLGGEQSSAPSQPASAGLVDTLDPLLSAPSAPSGGLLAGLALDAPAPASAPAAPAAPAAPGAKAGTLGAGATLPKDSAKEDIFGFVGAEMSKANK